MRTEIIAEIARMVEQAATVEQKLRAFAITKTKISRKRKVFFDSLETGMNADEISQYTQKKQAIQKKIREEEATLLTQVFTQGSKKGEIAILDTKEQNTIIFIFMTSLRGLKREMVLENSYTRMEPAIEMLVKMTMLTIKS